MKKTAATTGAIRKVGTTSAAQAGDKPKKSRGGKPTAGSRVEAIIAGLEALYPEAECELVYASPFQLLVATILSAQCTDKVVNQVTAPLFARFPDAAAMSRADVAEVERMVSRTGFFRQKAKNIVATARKIVEEFGGEVPARMEALITMPGAARKTANVVLGTAFGMNEGFVVDTHIARIAGRLGLTREEDPKKIEQDLMRLMPRELWTHLGHQIIWHGRRVCGARKPACDDCTLSAHCPSSLVGPAPALPKRASRGGKSGG